MSLRITQKHITDYLKIQAQKRPDKPALIFGARTFSWLELEHAVERASAFVTRSIDSGNRQKVVGLLLNNSPEFVITYMAILEAGHIALPLDPSYKKLELDAIVNQINPEFVITDGPNWSMLSNSKIKVHVSEVLSAPSDSGHKVRLSPDKQIASLLFTSGTTGQPKAATYSHANHIWNIQACSKVWNWTADDSILVSLPLSHWYGLVMGLSGAIYQGSTMYLQEWFDAPKALKLLSSGKISIFTHVPQAYMKLLELDACSHDLSKLRLCISGGAPLPPSVWQQFKDRFGIEITETYGSSETGRIAANLLGKPRPGSPGKVLPGVKLRFGKDGEVEIKSPGVFPGYFRNSYVNRKHKTDDGYWRTGDIGELRDGYLFLKGRVQEQIRRFGYTVSPRDVEWAMLQLPGIKSIQVVGYRLKDEPNDRLTYFVVSELSEDEIIAYCRDNLIFAWRPDRISYLNKLPESSNGKASLSVLKNLALREA